MNASEPELVPNEYWSDVDDESLEYELSSDNTIRPRCLSAAWPRGCAACPLRTRSPLRFPTCQRPIALSRGTSLRPCRLLSARTSSSPPISSGFRFGFTATLRFLLFPRTSRGPSPCAARFASRIARTTICGGASAPLRLLSSNSPQLQPGLPWPLPAAESVSR